MQITNKDLFNLKKKKKKKNINKNNLNATFQSAYKQYHSAETALIRVHNDILTAIDNRRTVILLLLDLSAAFDTVYHNILLSRLHERFGVTFKPFLWFQSYLSDRMQYVSVDGGTSSKHALQCGVPQGLVLGPILYLLYTSPLSDIIKKFSLSYHFYADDSQLYLFFQPTIPGDRDLAVSNIERCVLEIDHWMLVNRLKLNKDNTELLVISAKRLPVPIVQEISVVSETIFSSQKARNIGITFDNHFLFNDHIASIYKSSFYHLPGADPGEVKWVNFHPSFSEPPFLFFFSYPSNIEIIFDFSDIITKIHPPFQNPGSALVFVIKLLLL